MNKLFVGDCRKSMRDLISKGIKVQMCVTSPPYWGLRSYLPDRVKLKHDVPEIVIKELESLGVNIYRKSEIPSHLQQWFEPAELGLEPTLQEYIANMVEVFRLVKDLLADDGVLWVNMGDSYNGYMANQRGTGLETKRQSSRKYIEPGAGLRSHVLKNKDIIGVPWRLAFALQEDGYYLRQDVIWSKPNPMPESVTDRCTKAHEYIFLLAKNARYYFDADAISEIAKYPGDNRAGRTDKLKENEARCMDGGSRKRTGNPTGERVNKRSVWSVASQSYNGAHFATYPPALIEPCILAGSRPGDIVLDPFFGSGTTGEVAQNLGRQWIGCELNPEYSTLSDERTSQTGLQFTG